MKRIPEPELMEGFHQVRAYSEADFSQSDSQVVLGLEKYLKKTGCNINEKSLIIDVACGPGNISERLACRWPLAHVIGIDGSKQMLLEAQKRKKNHKFKNSLDRLSYYFIGISSIIKGDFPYMNKADFIVSNSALHHLHRPDEFWTALKKIGKKGCFHFHRDLRRPSSKMEALQLRSEHLDNAPSILKEDFLASLHAAFTLEEVKKQLLKEGLSQLNVSEVDDFYLEIIGTI